MTHEEVYLSNCVSVCSVSSSHHHQAAYKRHKGWAGEERGGAKYLELAVASPRPAQLSFVFMCKYAVNMSLSSAYRYIVHSIFYIVYRMASFVFTVNMSLRLREAELSIRHLDTSSLQQINNVIVIFLIV